VFEKEAPSGKLGKFLKLKNSYGNSEIIVFQEEAHRKIRKVRKLRNVGKVMTIRKVEYFRKSHP